jgi:hypothetical protein
MISANVASCHAAARSHHLLGLPDAFKLYCF